MKFCFFAVVSKSRLAILTKQVQSLESHKVYYCFEIDSLILLSPSLSHARLLALCVCHIRKGWMRR